MLRIICGDRLQDWFTNTYLRNKFGINIILGLLYKVDNTGLGTWSAGDQRIEWNGF